MFHVTLCIGPLHPSQSIGLVSGCALLWCRVSLYAPFTISLISLYFIMMFTMTIVPVILIYMAILFTSNYTRLDFLKLRSSGSANAQLPDVSAPEHSPKILDSTCYLLLLHVMFTFPTKILSRGVPGFTTDCPCSVWCRGLNTCLCMLVHFWKSSL